MRYLLAAWLTCLALSVSAASGRTDYDLDDNGLIEINDWADLNAIRTALDGTSLYGSSAGCPAAGCRGFELMADLEFDSNGDGTIDVQDAFWNDGKGWLPLGTAALPFTAEFNGNGHQIRDLWISNTVDAEQGLFGAVRQGKLSRLVLTGPLLSIAGRESVGILAGWIQDSEVVAVLTTGQVLGGSSKAGGLVGKADTSRIQAVFSSAEVRGFIYAGGLVGESQDTLIEGSLATGRTRLLGSYGYSAGGLAASGESQQISSRIGHWALDITGQPINQEKAGLGALLAELRCPLNADDSDCAPGKTLYPGWSEFQDANGQAYWQFGDGNQLPGLLLNGHLYRDSDGDGGLDGEDAFPRVRGVILDSDGDGAPDSRLSDLWLLTCDAACIQLGLLLDQFPNNAAASQDADLDGLPDAWNPGCDSNCQAGSDLTLDARPGDHDNDGIADQDDADDNNDGKPDVDLDSNGLIEIHSWAELDAVRHQLDGRGQRLTKDGPLNSSGCPGRLYGWQWVAECIGYELKTDLDFDTNGDGKLDELDQFWNAGKGWQALGGWYRSFSAVFAGNGHLIRNLMLNNRSGTQGLFGSTQDAQIRELGLTGPLTSIRGGNKVGGLVGELFYSSVEACFISGGQVVAETFDAGGLVGVTQQSRISASYASTQVSSNYSSGGLVAQSWDSQLSGVYSTSRVAGGTLASDNANYSPILNSYWARDIEPNMRDSVGVGIGVTLQQLKCPVATNDSLCAPKVNLYQDWQQWVDASGQPYWDFGNSQQLPALRLNGKVYRDTDADGLFDDEDLDDDNDGVPDSDDAFPGLPEVAADVDKDGLADAWLPGCDLGCQQRSGLMLDWALDLDKDGVPEQAAPGCDAQCQAEHGLSADNWDKFPKNRAAFADTDNDGFPDDWASGCDLQCQQASGLILDAFPLDASVSLDANGNGVPDRWNFGCDQSCQQAASYTLDPQDQVYGFWRHQDGQNYLLQYRGAQLVQSYPLLSVINDWQLMGSGDFNGDGATDLLWRHQSSGELYLFLFDRGQVRQQVRLGQVADLDWKLVAIADVDGDHTSDLIWYHAKTAQGFSWLIKQGALSQELGLPKLNSLGWQLVGSGDLTGDGVEDLVWRHNQTGDTWLFEMHQGQLQQELPLFSVGDPAWQVAAVADTNQDGKADLLWRHTATGWIYSMLMDGQADLFWRNPSTGQNYLLQLNGLQPPEELLMPEVADTGWHLGALLKP